jgi:hypothetical protein
MTKEEVKAIACAIANVKGASKAVSVPYDVPSVLALMTIVIGDAISKSTPEFSYLEFLHDSDYQDRE